MQVIENMATPAGLEPATISLEGWCSIQLSYGAVGIRRAGRIWSVGPGAGAAKGEVVGVGLDPRG
jgi:hypothetical protein